MCPKSFTQNCSMILYRFDESIMCSCASVTLLFGMTKEQAMTVESKSTWEQWHPAMGLQRWCRLRLLYLETVSGVHIEKRNNAASSIHRAVRHYSTKAP